MQARETFSIIIPNYNNSNTLRSAINSCLNQTVKANEIIVVDDGSSDDSRSLLNQFNEQIITIYQENRGVSAARNAGAKQATSKWLLFLDADDEFLPQRIESHRKIIEENTKINAVIGDQQNIQNGSHTQKLASQDSLIAQEIKGNSTESVSKELTENQLGRFLVEGPIEIRTLTIRKDIFDKIKGFPQGVKIGEDFHLFVKLFIEGKITYSSDVVAKYHIHENSVLRINKHATQISFINTLSNVKTEIQEENRIFRNAVKKREESERMNLAYALLRENKKIESIKYSLKTILRHRTLRSVRSLASIIAT